MATSKTRIVIVGGGIGGLFTALELAGEGEVTLVTDEDHFLFTPMLYEYLSGEVEDWHIAPKYSELLDARVKYMPAQVTAVDLQSRQIKLNGSSETFPYDILVLAVGGVTNYAGVEGAEEFAIPFRKIAHA